ncbi:MULTISPECIES: helix-turn-helix transcriptional regulator [unclassified Rhodococcus (in: high G+C Gram-positive bacteria)]|uniref:helix-turn-helix transcriptional regulator n=1 Tax=unclassified Rhodococcus (in: high G+C Gram-positive bacteria) TaxID=192944 RepID=UPI0006BA3093|nr:MULTISPECIES: WYL domain-containing protein [unclassified Rhodococcus (in: high G+C Gram-positive bacteria)]RGP44405.1 hypothetical protein AWH04_28595 [Rhodococcus erythropolis]
MRKVAAALPDSHRAEANRASARILVRPDGFAWPSLPDPHLVELQRAVIDGLRVKMLYTSRAASAAERTLDPIGLVCAGSYWYLLAEQDGVERTYRVSRIEELTVLAEPAIRAVDVDLEANFLLHWNAFRKSFPKVLVSCLVRENVWDSVAGKSLRVHHREGGVEGWWRAELEFAEDAHAVRALWAAGSAVVALRPLRIRDELRTRAIDTAASCNL